MQTPARQVHSLRVGRFVQASQHGGQSGRVRGLDSSLASGLKEGVQAFVPERPNHG